MTGETLLLKPDGEDARGLPFFIVQDASGATIGRIFESTPGTWFWGVAHPHERGRVGPHYGHAEAREAAMAALRKFWDSKTD